MAAPVPSPAAERNKQPILEVLRQVLPPAGRALEIASGSGQHVYWFAAHLPQWTWQPTECQRDALDAIAQTVAQQGLPNVLAPRLLDVTATHWPFDDDAQGPARFDAIFCANMLHASAWPTCAGLMHGSARHLAPNGVLITYGPYLEDGVPTCDSNLEFDQSLRARNPEWGLRRREEVEQTAHETGLKLAQRHVMPANNLLLVWARRR